MSRDPFRGDTPPGFAWDPTELGNHRAVVRVDAPAEAVAARIPWRRRPEQAADTAVVVEHPASGARSTEARVAWANARSGEVVFRPWAGPGLYHVYYLPYACQGVYYPKTSYPGPDGAGSSRPADAAGPPSRLPRAAVLDVQCVEPFHACTEMEDCATADECAAVAARDPAAPFLVFPEDRAHIVRMRNRLPRRWVESGPGGGAALTGVPGEFVAFQLAVWAVRACLPDVRVRFHQASGPADLGAEAFRCLNLGGVSCHGTPFARTVSVAAGEIVPLWCGIAVPAAAPRGVYQAHVEIEAAGRTVVVPIELTLGPPGDADPDDDPARLSRLRWLDSRLADDDTVVPPFTPVEVRDRTLGVLGRAMTLGDLGLPDQIASSFSECGAEVGGGWTEVLAAPIRLDGMWAGGSTCGLTGGAFELTEHTDGHARWHWSGHLGAGMDVTVRGLLDFDGTAEFEIAVTAVGDSALDDIRLTVPIRKGASRYMMGLGCRGGVRPRSFEWAWGVDRNQDALWIGAPHAGLQITLKDERYVRPLNTNFYHQRPLVMPRSWCNDGAGRVRLEEMAGGDVLLTCSSGRLSLRTGDELRFDFRLAMTPFRPLRLDEQVRQRYCHAYRPVEEVAELGANVINVHHANEINPYINYPFLRPGAMKVYVDRAHDAGMLVKIYYTVRELTTRAPELWALRSLGDEVLSPGPGGGYSWLQEHLDEPYLAAWFAPNVDDSSVLINGMSRWQNHYVEGLDWLARNLGIDGLYLDDVAFDRHTMKRMRRILARRRPNPVIDLHSANQYNERDGFASSANLYMEHLPYIDRIWFGEYFDYDSAPDYWLVEVSGIPFGVMGEMLEKGGNPWRGVLFGMTNRLGWSTDVDPRPVWRLLDAFGAAESRMVGWWCEACPVRSDRPEVPVTVYIRPGAALVAIASWAPEPVAVRLSIDWDALGVDPARARLVAVASDGFQAAAAFAPVDPIPVEPGRGWMLELRGAGG